MTEEKYANPGMYLDEDNHERLLEENRPAYLRDDIDRLTQEVREIEIALKHVSFEEAERLRAVREEKIARIDELGEELEWYHGGPGTF